MPLRFLQLFARDLTGADASVTVELVERDHLDRDSGQIAVVPIRLTAAERKAFQDVRDRAKAFYQARLDKATADRLADPNAPVNLNVPLAGENP